MTQVESTIDLLRSPMEICWQFSYAIDQEQLGRLYSKAKSLHGMPNRNPME